jgi:hypothetical protein
MRLSREGLQAPHVHYEHGKRRRQREKEKNSSVILSYFVYNFSSWTLNRASPSFKHRQGAPSVPLDSAPREVTH